MTSSALKTQTAQVSCNVYVAGLPTDLTDQQLHELFSTCGPISSARIMRAKGTRASKGYGFVLFEDTNSANVAVATINGLILSGYRVQVRLAHPDASSTLRKFTKKPNSTASSIEPSPMTTPAANSLLPIVVPSQMTAAGTPFSTPVPQFSAASSPPAGQSSFLAAAQPFPSTVPSPFSVGLSGSVPDPTGNLFFPSPAFSSPLFTLPQQPVFIVMLSQDGQRGVNYPY